MSDGVMGTLANLVPDIEIYSIDGAFLNMKGFGYKNLHEFGKEIRATVLQHTGIPVGVGTVPTKTLAKMANRFAQKHYKITKNTGFTGSVNKERCIHSESMNKNRGI